jgi:hypothetical protein
VKVHAEGHLLHHASVLCSHAAATFR